MSDTQNIAEVVANASAEVIKPVIDIAKSADEKAVKAEESIKEMTKSFEDIKEILAKSATQIQEVSSTVKEVVEMQKSVKLKKSNGVDKSGIADLPSHENSTFGFSKETNAKIVDLKPGTSLDKSSQEELTSFMKSALVSNKIVDTAGNTVFQKSAYNVNNPIQGGYIQTPQSVGMFDITQRDSFDSLYDLFPTILVNGSAGKIITKIYDYESATRDTGEIYEKQTPNTFSQVRSSWGEKTFTLSAIQHTERYSKVLAMDAPDNFAATLIDNSRNAIRRSALYNIFSRMTGINKGNKYAGFNTVSQLQSIEAYQYKCDPLNDILHRILFDRQIKGFLSNMSNPVILFSSALINQITTDQTGGLFWGQYSKFFNFDTKKMLIGGQMIDYKVIDENITNVDPSEVIFARSLDANPLSVDNPAGDIDSRGKVICALIDTSAINHTVNPKGELSTQNYIHQQNQEQQVELTTTIYTGAITIDSIKGVVLKHKL